MGLCCSDKRNMSNQPLITSPLKTHNHAKVTDSSTWSSEDCELPPTLSQDIDMEIGDEGSFTITSDTATDSSLSALSYMSNNSQILRDIINDNLSFSRNVTGLSAENIDLNHLRAMAKSPAPFSLHECDSVIKSPYVMR
eukprot:1759_1